MVKVEVVKFTLDGNMVNIIGHHWILAEQTSHICYNGKAVHVLN
jgi:hypothetical protein